MHILLMGGFLGSGKTTIVSRLLHELDRQGLKVAVIENEVGTTGIDQQTLENGEIQVTSLFGGCVCCQLKGQFLTCVDTIRREIDPDWIVVELTGLALIEDIRDSIHLLQQADICTHTVCLADASRWRVLRRACADFIGDQMADVDLILLTKTDLHPDTADVIASIREINAESPILEAGQRSDEELWAAIRSTWRE